MKFSLNSIDLIIGQWISHVNYPDNLTYFNHNPLTHCQVFVVLHPVE